MCNSEWSRRRRGILGNCHAAPTQCWDSTRQSFVAAASGRPSPCRAVAKSRGLVCYLSALQVIMTITLVGVGARVVHPAPYRVELKRFNASGACWHVSSETDAVSGMANALSH
jgi:hypothetical protein